MYYRSKGKNHPWSSKSQHKHQAASTIQPRQVPAALGPQVRCLSSADVPTNLSNGWAEITNCRYLASYNLMEGLSKTILVPGRPPLWTPSAGNMKLDADSGQYYRDENAARFQDHPLEPVVRSIVHMDPSLDPSTVDIVACGSTMGDLLRFVRGKSEGFSFTVDIVGQTAFFVRRSLSPTELIEGIHGFGHNFVNANTTWSLDVKGSSSHQRVISYILGGKTILIRFEMDSYIMGQAEDFDSDNEEEGISAGESSVEDELQKLLSPQTQHAPTVQTTLLKKGRRIMQSSAIDIKTRSARKTRDDVMAEQVPRLWLRQIENIVLSFHNNGLFEPAVIEEIRSLIKKWENENQTAIAQLVNLINMIKEAAINANGRKLEVRCDESRVLQFHELEETEQEKWRAIPNDLREKWQKNNL